MGQVIKREPLSLPSYELLHERYEYVDGTLIYKSKVAHRIQIGDRADRSTSNGYRIVRIKQRKYKAHRVIWKMIHGVDPQGEIDHIDRDPSNNRIENLRVVNRVENCINRECVERNGGVQYYRDDTGKKVLTPLGRKLHREREVEGRVRRKQHLIVIPQQGVFTEEELKMPRPT